MRIAKRDILPAGDNQYGSNPKVNKEEAVSSIFVKVISNPSATGKTFWYAIRVSPNGTGFLGWALPDGTFTQGLDQRQEWSDLRIKPGFSAGMVIEMAEHFGWTVVNKQVPVEKVAPAGKSATGGIVVGILASFVVSTIWFGLVLILFGASGGLLVQTPSVANAWVGAVLILGGPVLIFLVGILPVYISVGGWSGIVGGLVAGFVGGVFGMMGGGFIQLIFLLFGSP